jgi:nitrite reductase (NO-forming)
VSTVAKPARSELEHHNLEASAAPTEREALAGKTDFESKCFACHSMGHGKKLGPDLAGVTKRRSADWIRRWLKSPEEMIAKDRDAKALLKEYNDVPMPNQNLTDAEIRQYMKYFEWYDAQPAGSVQSSGGGH